MANGFEITITPDSYKITLNRNDASSTKILCTLLTELGVVELSCSSKTNRYESAVVVSNATAENSDEAHSVSEALDSSVFSYTSTSTKSEMYMKDASLIASSDWVDFERKLDKASIKNEPEWCLLYSYFLLRDSNHTMHKNIIRKAYQDSGRYTKNRNKDFTTNIKKCVFKNWLTFDGVNIAITDEGRKHILEDLFIQTCSNKM